MRVTVLLEQYQASAVASLTPILEHSNRQIYRAELVDGLALVGLDRVATNAKSPRSDCVTHAHHIDSVTGRRARAGQVISGPDRLGRPGANRTSRSSDTIGRRRPGARRSVAARARTIGSRAPPAPGTEIPSRGSTLRPRSMAPAAVAVAVAVPAVRIAVVGEDGDRGDDGPRQTAIGPDRGIPSFAAAAEVDRAASVLAGILGGGVACRGRRRGSLCARRTAAG